MTAEIPSWMKRGGRGRGLGEITDPKTDQEVFLVDDPIRDDAQDTDHTEENSGSAATDGFAQDAAQENDAFAASHPTTAEPAAPEPAAPSPDDAASQAVLAAILPKLVGVRSVVIRVYGNDREAGPVLQELLRRRGMDVKISSITQIVPPPLSKLSVRYQGVDATITLAPDIGD
jgi:hypothetical protein